MIVVGWWWMCAQGAEPAPPLGGESRRTVVRPLGPEASVRGILGGPEDAARFALVVPERSRSVTYALRFDASASSLVAEVWHRGHVVDEARGDRLAHPRTIGVRPGERYGFVLTNEGPTTSYGLSVDFGDELWEREPNHAGHSPNRLPPDEILRGHLTDDDRFVVGPPSRAEEAYVAVAVEIEVTDGAAWLALVWPSGEACAPRLVEGRHREVIPMRREPLTVLLRPLVGQPDYRLRATPEAAR